MAVLQFRTRSAPPRTAGAYFEIPTDLKRRANGCVAELHFAMTQARTASPEARAAFNNTCQWVGTEDDGTFKLVIGRAKGQFLAVPVVQFYTSPMDGWVCVYGQHVLRHQDIETLVAEAHQLISTQPGLALGSISALRKLPGRLAHS